MEGDSQDIMKLMQAMMQEAREERRRFQEELERLRKEADEREARHNERQGAQEAEEAKQAEGPQDRAEGRANSGAPPTANAVSPVKIITAKPPQFTGNAKQFGEMSFWILRDCGVSDQPLQGPHQSESVTTYLDYPKTIA